MNDKGVNACRETIRARMQAGNILVSTTMPAVIGFDSPRGYMCRHGNTYWVDYPT